MSAKENSHLVKLPGYEYLYRGVVQAKSTREIL